jgi:hypothetical protein
MAHYTLIGLPDAEDGGTTPIPNSDATRKPRHFLLISGWLVEPLLVCSNRTFTAYDLNGDNEKCFINWKEEYSGYGGTLISVYWSTSTLKRVQLREVFLKVLERLWFSRSCLWSLVPCGMWTLQASIILPMLQEPIDSIRRPESPVLKSKGFLDRSDNCCQSTQRPTQKYLSYRIAFLDNIFPHNKGWASTEQIITSKWE